MPIIRIISEFVYFSESVYHKYYKILMFQTATFLMFCFLYTFELVSSPPGV